MLKTILLFIIVLIILATNYLFIFSLAKAASFLHRLEEKWEAEEQDKQKREEK